jgi:hypothetical protein
VQDSFIPEKGKEPENENEAKEQKEEMLLAEFDCHGSIEV